MKNQLIWEDSAAGKDWREEEKGTTEGVLLDGIMNTSSVQFVQLLSHVQLVATAWITASQASLSIKKTPRIHSDLRPSNQWCHPAISSSVVPFSSCPQFLLASESFPMSQFFAWGGRSTGVSALAPVLSKKSQGWSPSEWTGWINLQSKGMYRNSRKHWGLDRNSRKHWALDWTRESECCSPWCGK